MALKTTYVSALLKWELIVDMWDYSNSYKVNMEAILEILPSLRNYSAFCTFCDVWGSPQCHGCPLTEEWGHDCRQIDSLYDRWDIATTNKTNGKDVAEQIRASVKIIYFKRGGSSYESIKELLDRYSSIHAEIMEASYQKYASGQIRKCAPAIHTD